MSSTRECKFVVVQALLLAGGIQHFEGVWLRDGGPIGVVMARQRKSRTTLKMKLRLPEVEAADFGEPSAQDKETNISQITAKQDI